MESGLGADLVGPPNMDADDGTLKSEALLGRLEHLRRFRLRPQDVAEKFGHPPNDRIAVKPNDPFGEVPRNGRRQKLGSRVHRVDDGQLDDRGVRARPVRVISGRHGGAVFAHRLEDVLESLLVVPPAVALEDQRPLGAVSNDEAVDRVVNLNQKNRA